jgi:hypothetical protein
VSFDATTLCVASQRVFIVVVFHFVIDSVRKLLDIPSYIAFLLLTSAQSRSIIQPRFGWAPWWAPFVICNGLNIVKSDLFKLFLCVLCTKGTKLSLNGEVISVNPLV